MNGAPANPITGICEAIPARVSLTVSALGRGWFEAALIPHTLAATNLGDRRAGEAVNLEVDLIARYLESLLKARGPARRTR